MRLGHQCCLQGSPPPSFWRRALPPPDPLARAGFYERWRMVETAAGGPPSEAPNDPAHIRVKELRGYGRF